MAWKGYLCSGAHYLIRNICICKYIFYFLHHIWKSKVFVWINLITWNPIFRAEETKPRRNKLKCQLHLLPDVYIKIFCYYKYKMHILVHELKTRRIVGRAPLIFSSTLDGGEWSASRPGRFSLWDRILGSSQQGDWVSSNSFWKVLGNRTICCSYWDRTTVPWFFSS
jgi:hypothetical protein